MNFLLNNHILQLFPTFAQTLSPKKLPSPIVLQSPSNSLISLPVPVSPGSGESVIDTLLAYGETVETELHPQWRLRAMLQQTLVSFADSRWEVRRMADQVLPALTELLCWFSMSRLNELWNTMLTTNSDLLACTSCLSLRHALRKCQVFHSLLPSLSSPGDVAARARVAAFVVSVNDSVRLPHVAHGPGWRSLAEQFNQRFKTALAH